MNIRLAIPGDSASLLEIYAQYIDTAVTFEYELPTVAAFAQRIRTIAENYPYLVCEENNKILGYAYAHRQMERAAYQWNAELSVYLDRSALSRGIGTRLYHLLIELLRLQGIKTVYGGVTLPNEKSERLHRSLGFRLLGIYQNTGYKCGQWHDVAWFEKQIAPYEEGPATMIPLRMLPAQQFEDLLRHFHAQSEPRNHSESLNADNLEKV